VHGVVGKILNKALNRIKNLAALPEIIIRNNVLYPKALRLKERAAAGQ